MSGSSVVPRLGLGFSPATCHFAHYFVLCGIEAASRLEPDELSDIKKDCRPRKDTVTHSFLVMPECLYPLCRCDLLQKLFGLPPYPLRGTEREFLEAVGYYNLWIPGLIEIAKPLDSNVTKPFHLHVSEVRGITKGVLIQTLGPWKRPVAYLSKRLDPVVAGWPACLRAVATTALLVKEADK
ncbi:hypothetical protein QTO34_001438 [Cnephaeus nilssonii]|uniref:Uncharacterized protein n=1 Tax=Cnephaeus nilssonii TaxID=3371016 RepID=A0AA40LNL7_CNENI|nr:hypothetical protein QTO34_001438 [Eptesicus nilssonii]